MDAQSSRHTPRPRPWSKYDALNVFQWVVLLPATLCGISLGIGLAEQTANAGVLAHLMPFLIPPVVAIGLSAAWHFTLGMAAHAEDLGKRALSVIFGITLFIIACATTAWMLASLIGGASALKTYQLSYTKQLGAVIELVASNAAGDGKILTAVTTAANGIAAAAEAEASGALTGKKGKGTVYQTLLTAAQAIIKADTPLKEANDDRDEHLAAARKFLAAANEAISNENEQDFREAITASITEISEADKIHLANMVVGIGSGLIPHPHVIDAVNEITKVAQATEKKRINFIIETYTPISKSEAIAAYPQALPWITAIFIEAIPLVMLGLLLSLWREEEYDRNEPTTVATNPTSFPRDSRPKLVSGE